MNQPAGTPGRGPRRAIILAAGAGRRLGNRLPEGRPKSLLEVCGRTILQHQLAQLVAVGVQRVVLAVGCGAEHLREACAAAPFPQLEYEFVHNPDFATTNTIVSLHLAAPFMTEDFYLLNGDVLFSRTLLACLCDVPVANALAVECKLCGEEEVKAQTEAGGRIRALRKDISPETCMGEFVGVARFSVSSSSAIATSLRVAVEEEKRRASYFEYALERICHQVPFHAVPVAKGEPVIEIDFPADMDRARDNVIPRLRALGAW